MYARLAPRHVRRDRQARALAALTELLAVNDATLNRAGLLALRDQLAAALAELGHHVPEVTT